MAKMKYRDFKFKPATIGTINQANVIIAEYAAQGFDLTLRQLYYQFVARNLIANNDKEYTKLGNIVSDGRMAGLIDWDAITDRTRYVRQNNHWDNPQAIVEACAKQFQIDKWSYQSNYVEVWVEKDVLVGVLEVACRPLDVPFYACRGYNSVSEIRNAAYYRFRPKMLKGKKCTILYLGDHDPSGIDMTRDVEERINLFSAVKSVHITVKRLALNMDQVDEYNPPENPTKMTDSRASDYVENYGEHCWELDALPPDVIRNLITEEVENLRDEPAWNAALADETQHKVHLKGVADHWEEVVNDLPTTSEDEDTDG